MAKHALPFQYQSEKNETGLTGFAGLPLYIELAEKSGLIAKIQENLQTKQHGWKDVEILLSLILLNLSGGECISDIDRLEKDKGLRRVLMQLATHGMKRAESRAYEKRWRKSKERALPSNAAVHRYLDRFHNVAEELRRKEHEAFIPEKNSLLEGLVNLTKGLADYAYQINPMKEATLDQDATLIETNKRNAKFCYKAFKSYQPFNTYWAEMGMVIHSEF